MLIINLAKVVEFYEKNESDSRVRPGGNMTLVKVNHNAVPAFTIRTAQVS